MNKNHYVNNLTANLENRNLYEKMNTDTTEEIKRKVLKFVNKLERNGRMPEKTAAFIKSKIEDTGPGAYTENPKTHKFDEESHDMNKGFKAR